MKKYFLVVHCLKHIVISLCLATTLSFAQEKIFPLEEIVVTATRIEEPKSDVPAAVQIITQEDIKNSTAKNVGDLIAQAALGHVHKYPGALTSVIGLRGLRTDISSVLKNRVLILINGHHAGTVNLAKIPIEDVERIEIVKGPASVLYGSEAMGGVINIITKKGKEGIHCSIGHEIGSWKFQKTQVELNGKEKAFDFYFTASRCTSDDFETKGYGKIENTGYNDRTLSARLGYKFFDKNHISVGFQYWRGWNIGSPDARYNPDPDEYSNKRRNCFDIGYKGETFNARYYCIKDRDECHEGPTAGGSMPSPANSIYLKKTDTQGASFQKTFHIGDHRIIIGSQWDSIKVKSTSTTGRVYDPNSKYETHGVFAEGRLSLFDKKTFLSAGLRYDYFENEILQTPGIRTLTPRKETVDHLTARGGVVCKLTDKIRFKGNIGTGFRAPAPDELAADYVTWARFMGNPNLKPERSISYDAGIECTRNFFKGDLTFFHTGFKDKILRYRRPDGTRTFKNVDGATLQGIEVNLSYDIGGALGGDFSIQPFTNITYHTKHESKDKDEIKIYGKTLLYTPKWTGAFGIRFSHDKWDARLIANYTGKEKVEDWNPLSPTYGKVVDKADFTVVNLKGSFRPVKNIEITASIENLFDKAYEYVLSYPMPRRTLAIGMKLVF